jgi:hypothetical protein
VCVGAHCFALAKLLYLLPTPPDSPPTPTPTTMDFDPTVSVAEMRLGKMKRTSGVGPSLWNLLYHSTTGGGKSCKTDGNKKDMIKLIISLVQEGTHRLIADEQTGTYKALEWLEVPLHAQGPSEEDEASASVLLLLAQDTPATLPSDEDAQVQGALNVGHAQHADHQPAESWEPRASSVSKALALNANATERVGYLGALKKQCRHWLDNLAAEDFKNKGARQFLRGQLEDVCSELGVRGRFEVALLPAIEEMIRSAPARVTGSKRKAPPLSSRRKTKSKSKSPNKKQRRG